MSSVYGRIYKRIKKDMPDQEAAIVHEISFNEGINLHNKAFFVHEIIC